MSTKRVFNFSAGPAVLPVPVLEKAQSEMLNYSDSGMSVMEMSHRSKEFSGIIANARDKMKTLLNVPDTHEVLFVQGGATLQFAMAPINLYKEGKPVDIIHTGSWTKKAISEHKKLATCRLAASTEDDKYLRLPSMDEIDLKPDASYVYMCSNNTIYGTQFKAFPETGSIPLVCDMSSDILSRPIDVSKFDVIFAGAQKNIGPSGVTIVICKKGLFEEEIDNAPTYLQYKTHIDNESLYNTPPTYAIYIAGLVLDWLSAQGGVEAMHKKNVDKAKFLYDAIDKSELFECPIPEQDRSIMNVVFVATRNREELEPKFVKEAEAAGMTNLKGHRSIGGLRASIYNAHPREGVETLANFIADFESKNK